MKSKEQYLAEINEFLQDIDLKALAAVLAFTKLMYRQNRNRG